MAFVTNCDRKMSLNIYNLSKKTNNKLIKRQLLKKAVQNAKTMFSNHYESNQLPFQHQRIKPSYI